MPLQATSGAASYDAFGGGVAAVPNYIEDVFSTYLYTGNGSTNVITNGINLSGKGGLVWMKDRTTAYEHYLLDTARGNNSILHSNNTNAASAYSNGSFSVSTTGFTVTGSGTDSSSIGGDNESGDNYASWTFRKQPKFFDVVTFTSNGSGGGTFSHNLGSVPGCVIFKSTSVASSWLVYHQSTGTSNYLELQSPSAQQSASNWISVNSTSVTVDSGWLGANRSIIAYLFAHNAGGFGLTGTDNVISCGSFTLDGSGYSPNVELGYEPQWVLIKPSSATGNWLLVDTMRGWVNPAGTAADDANLRPNLSDAEATNDIGWPYATGFNAGYRGTAGQTWIYIAIRRGPMKVPTVGTSVFSPVAQTKSSFPSTVTAGFPVDLTIEANRASDGLNSTAIDRLRGGGVALITSGTASEYGSAGCSFASNTVFSDGWLNNTSNIYWMFRRAPSFFDEVCYTGTGGTATFSHNLGVVPELMIIKCRSNASTNWAVYASSEGASKGGYLNLTDEFYFNGSGFWNDTSPTSSIFTVGASSYVNGSGRTYVAYLFATCAGVSKVGSYTGNGSTQTINCGFTGGARFVLIKRTDASGDWYVYDTARGMTTLTDPYLFLNSTAAETATLGSVTTVSTGFALNSSILAAINASGGTYIFLAIA